MNSHRRAGFTATNLMVALAIIGFLIGLLLPAIQKVRESANRLKSANNMKQLALAAHNYHDTNGCFAPGVDANGFSTVAYFLPYIEQGLLFKKIDFKKAMTDAGNAAARQAPIKLLIDPSDGGEVVVGGGYAPTNYLFSAGSQPSLENNDGMFYLDSKVGIGDVTDGTSNTLMTGATLRGDGKKQFVDVQRQYVFLKDEAALPNLNDESGVKDLQDNKNIAGDRCARWIDGSFLQGTFTCTRVANDPRPDVSCNGKGGLSALRNLNPTMNLGFVDGSVRPLTKPLELEVWKALAGRSDGRVIPQID